MVAVAAASVWVLPSKTCKKCKAKSYPDNRHVAVIRNHSITKQQQQQPRRKTAWFIRIFTVTAIVLHSVMCELRRLIVPYERRDFLKRKEMDKRHFRQECGGVPSCHKHAIPFAPRPRKLPATLDLQRLRRKNESSRHKHTTKSWLLTLGVVLPLLLLLSLMLHVSFYLFSFCFFLVYSVFFLPPSVAAATRSSSSSLSY